MREIDRVVQATFVFRTKSNKKFQVQITDLNDRWLINFSRVSHFGVATPHHRRFIDKQDLKSGSISSMLEGIREDALSLDDDGKFKKEFT